MLRFIYEGVVWLIEALVFLLVSSYEIFLGWAF